MRSHVLAACMLAVLLANLLMFGALSNTELAEAQPTPRHVYATFTPNPVLIRRLVTVTSTPVSPTSTPTRVTNELYQGPDATPHPRERRE